jgi:hypothetical protein
MEKIILTFWAICVLLFILQAYLPKSLSSVLAIASVMMVILSFFLVKDHPKGFLYTHHIILSIIILFSVPSIFFFKNVPGSFWNSINMAVFGSIISYLIFMLLYFLVFGIYKLLVK